MSLDDAERRVEERKPKRRCPLAQILDELSPADLAVYERMVAQGKSNQHIATVFNEDDEHDWDINEATVRRHRNDLCSCR